MIKMQLIQHPPATSDTVILGAFCAAITEVLNPNPKFTSDATSAEVDLLFCPCKIFPGIIAPKAEVSTRIQIRDHGDKLNLANKMNPVTVPSKFKRNRLSKGDKIIRQKGVCHTKYNFSCKCFLPKCYDIKATSTGKNIRPYETAIRPKSAVGGVDDITADEDDDDCLNDQNCNKDNVDVFNGYDNHRKMMNLRRVSSAGEYRKKTDEKQKFCPCCKLPDDIYDGKSAGLKDDKTAKKKKNAAPNKLKLCPCCTGNQSKVRFRKFSPGYQQPDPPERKPSVIKQPIPKKSERENKVNESTEGKEKSECDVCNCSICLKYEAYFIHRAIEHKRGGTASEFQDLEDNQKSTSETIESEEPPIADLSPTKCFCFKDKKDFTMSKEKQHSNRTSSKEKCTVCKCPLNEYNSENNQRADIDENNVLNSSSSEKCIACQCPLPSAKTNAERRGNLQTSESAERCKMCQCPLPPTHVNAERRGNLQTSESAEKCKMCQCPLPPTQVYPIKIENYSVDDQCDQLRKQFYNDLDKYYGQIKNCYNRTRGDSVATKRNETMKKPSSRLLYEQKKFNWGYKELNNKGAGIWEINAADWNRIQL
ncbi:hypothetical protein O3M35_001484 [Rhynocoris fuscipes]|uniref:Spermatogenesis-associated protein 6 N-terminal domain-containing protein n=1 Tax=Rhynocoris fuscipes TaxID=488301 RepID=A0AAW1CUD5_9HEMI